MADRYDPPAPRSGGERRPAPPSSTSGERRQAPPSNTGGERRPPSSAGGERRQTPPPYTGGERRQSPPIRTGGERRPDPYITGGRRQTPPRRNDVIRCENCGEDYSITYKRCPFCDERPGRGGVSGKRVANTRGGGYGRPASTLKTVTWIASFVVVCVAMVIIYRFIGAPIFGGGKDPGSSSQSGVSSSQGSASSSQGGGDVSTPPGVVDPGPDPNVPDGPDAPAQEVQGTIVNAGTGLNVRSGPGTENSKVGSLKNASQVVVLGEENGWYQIRYNGNNIGYVRKDYVSTPDAPVAVQPQQPTTSTPNTPSTPDANTPSTPSVASGTKGTIVNAGTGLNIRSGPGTDNSVVASAANGAQVTVLGEENGWYKIRYSGSSTGYVRKDYVSVG